MCIKRKVLLNFVVTQYVVVREYNTWQDARNHCVAMGARLFEIRSDEKYDDALQLYQEIGGFYWVGANDIQEENNWVWNSDQEDVNLNVFWRNGRPSFDRDSSNCAAMFSVGMFDLSCTTRFRSICDLN